MKKKDKDLNRVSMFHNAEDLIIVGFCFLGYLGMLIYHLVGEAPFTYRVLFDVKVMTPIAFGLVLYLLSRRVIDSKGVSSTFLGIKYRYISWQNLHHYTIEKIWPVYAKKRKSPDRCQIMLVFKAIPVEYGKSTTIMVPATKEARALAEKYFGPPAFVQDGISFDDDKK